MTQANASTAWNPTFHRLTFCRTAQSSTEPYGCSVRIPLAQLDSQKMHISFLRGDGEMGLRAILGICREVETLSRNRAL